MAFFSSRLRTISGAVCLGAGALLLLALLLALPLWINVSCQHSPAGLGSGPTHCQLRGSSLIGLPWRNQQIENVVGAEVNLEAPNLGWVYRVSLYTYEKEIPLATYSVSYGQAEKARSQLQEFLNLDFERLQSPNPAQNASSPSPSRLSLSYGPPWPPLLASAALSLLLISSGGFLLWLR